VTDAVRQWTEEQRRWDDQPAETVLQMIHRHNDELESLKLWRSELRGAMALIKLTLGTSIISGLLAAVALADLILRGRS
jgi:hypothetical protein